MFTNIRIDTGDEVKLRRCLEKQAKDNPDIKYLLAYEIGKKTGKIHYQGWMNHTHPRTEIRTAFTNRFPKLKGGALTIVATHDVQSEYGYIIDNEEKPDFDFNTCITNYTDEEFKEIQQLAIHHVPREVFLENKAQKARPKSTDWWTNCLNAMDREAVIDGKICYKEALQVFKNQPWPKALGKTTMMEKYQALISALELRHRYTCTSYYRESVAQHIEQNTIYWLTNNDRLEDEQAELRQRITLRNKNIYNKNDVQESTSISQGQECSDQEEEDDQEEDDL